MKLCNLITFGLFLFLITVAAAWAEVPTIIIEPVNPQAGGALTCLINNQVDNNYIYIWSKEGSSESFSGNPLPQGKTRAEETWTCRVYFPSYPSDIFIGEASVEISGEVPPQEEGVTITIEPPNPNTYNDLTAKINGAVNPLYIYVWSSDSKTVTGNPLSADHTEPGEIWRVRVYFPSWPSDILIGESAPVTIQGGVPPSSLVDIKPDQPKTKDDLRCLVGGQTNNNFIFYWYKDNQLTDQNQAVLPDEQTKKGESWLCEVYFPSWPTPIFFGKSEETIQNTPPTLQDIPEQTAQVNQLFTYTLAASDADADEENDELDFTLENAPEGMIVNSLGQISWTPSSEQERKAYSVKAVVSDSEGVRAEKPFQIRLINRLPQLNPIGNQATEEDQTLSFEVSGEDADNDGLEYSIAGEKPAGSEFTCSDNQPLGFNFVNYLRYFFGLMEKDACRFTWTPTYEQADTYQVTFQAKDNFGGVDQETVTITVANKNRAPTFEEILDKKVEVNKVISFEVKASDLDNDLLTYSLEKKPEETATFEKRVFTWTPKKEGVFKLVFKVEDGQGGMDQEEVVITVTKTEVIEHPPVLTLIGNKTIDEGKTLSFALSATDEDKDALTYSMQYPKENPPTGAQLNGQAFSWTPTYTQAGVYSVTFTVSDGKFTDEEKITITVKDVPISENLPPELDFIGPKTVREGQTLTFVVTAEDPNDDSLTYAAENLPAGASFVRQTFSWTPDYSQGGQDYFVVFKVSDGEFTDEERIPITVIDEAIPNTPPRITSAPLRTGDEGKLYTYQVKVYNMENDPLIYTLLQGPRGMSLDEKGLLSWEPEKQERACISLQVMENTPDRFSDRQSFCLNIQDTEKALKFNNIVLSSEFIQAGDYLTLNFDLSNEGEEELKNVKITAVLYELGVERAAGPFDLEQGESNHRQLVLEIPPEAEAGEYTLRITASNDETSHVVHRPVNII